MNVIDAYLQRVQDSHRELGIDPEYARRTGLALCREPAVLVDTELDYYDRPQRLTPEAFQAWQAMRTAAGKQGVVLHLISAFRSLTYQHELIARKLEKGTKIEDVLAVNAAPGFSQHHTGRAIDIGTENCPAVEEEFDKTLAFQWLEVYAGEYDYSLSYPPDNPCGIAYEPWHWCFRGD